MKHKLLARYKYEFARIAASSPPVALVFFALFIFAGLFVVNPGQTSGCLLFTYQGGIRDIAGLFFFFGSHFMLYMGADAYGSGNHAFAVGNTVIRLTILNGYFILLSVLMYLARLMPGQGSSTQDFRTFGIFLVYLLLFLTFFYTAGLFIRTISNTKQTAFVYSMLAWFFFITFIPGTAALFLSAEYLGISAGAWITAFFILLFYTSVFVLWRRFLPRLNPAAKPRNTFRKGGTYFILCKDKGLKNRLFFYYKLEPRAACIDAVRPGEFDANVSPRHLAAYLSALESSPWENMLEHLQILGIDLTAPRKKQQRAAVDMMPTVMIQKILFAAAAARDRETVVINDFLKGHSRQTERQFLELIVRLNKSGRTVLYLGTDIFTTSLPFEDEIHIDDYKSFKIDPPYVNLR